MDGFPRQAGNPLCMSPSRVSDRLPAVRVPEPHMPVVTTGGEHSLPRLPFCTENPTFVAGQLPFRQLDFHVPETGGSIARARGGVFSRR